jgi:ABC transport system ATP-binding/permease protein
MWKLCVVDDESNRTMVKLVRADYSIGRAEDSTIRLTERNISRTHARLFRDNGAWVLEDRESFTGSFINGERVKGARQVKHGDTIQLGDYRLDLSDEEAELAAAQAPQAEAAAPAAPLPDRFIVVQGPDVGTVFALTEQKLLVGRGEECQIALDDASVSRVHLEVIRTEHGLMVLDQGSSNGLRINGTDLPSAMLRSGDLLELGDVRLKFVPAGVEDVAVGFTDGAAHVAEASPAHVSMRSTPPRTVPAVALFGVGVVALAIAIGLALRSSGDDDDSVAVVSTTPAEPAAPAVSDGPTALLAEAKALAEQGAVVLAHRKLNDVPADSAIRQTEEFKEIERRWADEIFRAAEVSPDPAERRRMLERIARTTALDPDRRRRAAEELDKLDAEVQAVPVSELPNADAKGRAKMTVVAKQKPPRKPAAPSSRPSATGGAASESGEAGESAAPAPSPAPPQEAAAAAPTAKPQEPAPPKPKPAPQKEAKEGPELIRSIPF